MHNDQFGLLIEQFAGSGTPAFRHTPLHIERSVRAVESLTLPCDAVFESDVDMQNHILRIHGGAVFKGAIRNATVLVLGNATVEGTCTDSRIFALDALHLADAESCTLFCCADCVAGGELRSTPTAAGGSISGTTTVTGSAVMAGGCIAVHDARNHNDTVASLTAGSRALCASGVHLLSTYISRLIRLRKHARAHRVAGGPDDIVQRLSDDIEKRQVLAELLRNRAGDTAHTSVAVSGTLAAGVTIAVCEHHLTTDRPLHGAIICLYNGALVCESHAGTDSSHETLVQL